jgi:hypothetical protein
MKNNIKIEDEDNLKIIGWREVIDLPLWNAQGIQAKIDTGAKTSALHAENIEYFKRNKQSWLRFVIHPERKSKTPEITIEALFVEFRSIKSSNGMVQERPVVKTSLLLDGDEFELELTLVNRDIMGYRMLLGREALKNRYLVNAGLSYLLSQNPNKSSKNCSPGEEDS